MLLWDFLCTFWLYHFSTTNYKTRTSNKICENDFFLRNNFFEIISQFEKEIIFSKRNGIDEQRVATNWSSYIFFPEIVLEEEEEKRLFLRGKQGKNLCLSETAKFAITQYINS